MAGDVTLVVFVPEPPFPGGLSLGAPWSHLEGLWESQALAEVGEQTVLSRASVEFFLMNTKPAQPGQGGATQVAAVDLAVQSQLSLSPVDDGGVGYPDLPPGLSLWLAAEWFGRW